MDFTPACTCSSCRIDRFSRRRFLRNAGLAAAAGFAGLRLRGATEPEAQPPVVPIPGVPIIDLHQHCTYRGRPDDRILLHQRNNGVRTTILLPAGSTGGLGVGAAGVEHAAALARSNPARFAFFANENAYRPGAPQVIERWLKAGGIGIGELKDAVACDSVSIGRVAEVAREYDVPMLMHFQEGTYNDGFARFHRVLEKYPTVKFIAHANTFWAFIDARYKTSMGLTPRGPVAAGGLSDRWLADYPNFYGDLSAGSGNSALARDAEFSRAFLARHQDKLLYGSDCNCFTGVGPACLGAVKLGFLKQLCATTEIRDKLLFGNLRQLCRFQPGQLG